MAQQYIAEGKVFPLVVSGSAIVSGDLVLMSAMVGVALKSGNVGDRIQVAVEGVYEVAKAAGAVSQGAKLYYDAAAHNLTTTATSNTFAGYAYADAANGDTTIKVKLPL